MEINISEDESKVNNLRIGRLFTDKEWDIDSLIFKSLGMNIDVLKLKVSLEDEYVFSKLKALNINSTIYSILIRQSISIDKINIPKNLALQMKVYERTLHEDILRKLILEILSDDTATYYKDDLYNSLFDKTNVINSATNYYLDFCNEKDCNKYNFLAYHNGELIGFCTLDTTGDAAEGIFMGLNPKYRSNDFAVEFVYTEQLQSKLSHCKYYNVNTVLLNPRSLNTTLRTGMKITGAFLNINIYTLFDKLKPTAHSFFSDSTRLFEKSIHAIETNFKEYINGYCVFNYAINKSISNENRLYTIHTPYIYANKILFLIRGEEGRSFYYITFEKL